MGINENPIEPLSKKESQNVHKEFEKTVPEREVEERIQRASKPVQSKVERTFNLKNIFDKVEEEQIPIENFEDKPKDEFTEETLKIHWNEYLNTLKSENQIPAFNALQSGKIELKENFLIYFEFTSATLANELQLQRERLMNFLREKLNNYGIDFEVEVISNTTVNYIKTKSEVFNELAKKNSLLVKLKDELGLDYNSDD